MKKTGIVSYGAYIPLYRLSLGDIADAWQKDAKEILSSLGIKQKSVSSVDEDAVTLAVESSIRALSCVKIPADHIQTVFVGSESHPYAVNPTATIVGEFLGIGNNYLAADMQFACKAGSAGMQAIAGLIDSSHITLGLAVGSDTAQSQPHDALEYTSAAASVSYLLGDTSTYSVIVELEAFTSYSSDTPDFWRRDGIRYPTHAGRFTGEPAYFAHVLSSTKKILEKTALTPQDITYCVFHMPNGKFPRDAAKRMGFSHEQLSPSLTIDSIGNPYSASSLLGFASVLDTAKPGDRILLVSYGSGAGSDAFVWKVTEQITTYRKRKNNHHTVQHQLAHTTPINYIQYLKQTHKI